MGGSPTGSVDARTVDAACTPATPAPMSTDDTMWVSSPIVAQSAGPVDRPEVRVRQHLDRHRSIRCVVRVVVRLDADETAAVAGEQGHAEVDDEAQRAHQFGMGLQERDRLVEVGVLGGRFAGDVAVAEWSEMFVVPVQFTAVEEAIDQRVRQELPDRRRTIGGIGCEPLMELAQVLDECRRVEHRRQVGYRVKVGVPAVERSEPLDQYRLPFRRRAEHRIPCLDRRLRQPRPAADVERRSGGSTEDDTEAQRRRLKPGPDRGSPSASCASPRPNR